MLEKKKRRPIMTDEMRQFMDEADARLRAQGIEPGDRLSFRELDEDDVGFSIWLKAQESKSGV